jgi:hypothetical protein
MILGLTITGPMVVVGGSTLFALVLFQVLLGLRVIKLGAKHRVVHRWTAFTILAVAAVHGSIAALFALGGRLG